MDVVCIINKKKVFSKKKNIKFNFKQAVLLR